MIEEEISLKELVLILFKEWKTITSITITSLIFSVTFIFFFNETSYTTIIEGSLSKIDHYDTSYGVYSTNIVKIDEQINLINSHEFIDYLNTIENNPFTVGLKVLNSSDFTILIQSNEELVAKNVANEVIQSFESYLNYNLQSKALSYFFTLNKININKLKDLSQNNQELLEVFKTKLVGVQPVLQATIINPEYQIIQSEITRLELTELTNTIEINRLASSNENLYGHRSISFQNYLSTNEKFDQVNVSLLISDKTITQSDKRFEPLITTAVAIVLGIMMGIFIALFKSYWKNN